MTAWIEFAVSDARRWYAMMAVVLLLGGAWTWLSAVPAPRTTGGNIPAPREGFLAPDFTLDLLSGGQAALSGLRGKVVVINFWASWCPPCRAEMPALDRVYEAYRARGLEVLAVNTTYQDTEAAATGFAGQNNLSFPIPLDRDGSVSARYLLRALPSTYFVDRKGVIRRVVVGGPMSETVILSTVEPLLNE